MTLPADAPIPSLALRAPKKGQTVLAWLAILLLFGVIVGSRFLPDWLEHGKDTTDDKVSMRLLELQGRVVVGAALLAPDDKDKVFEQAEALNRGSIPQRLRYVTLVGEFKGPTEALTALRQIDDEAKKAGQVVSTHERTLATVLQKLYLNYERRAQAAKAPVQEPAPVVGKKKGGKKAKETAIPRNYITTELGWFGKLALNPPDSQDQGRADVEEEATRTCMVAVGAGGVVGVLAVIGLVGLPVFLILAAAGKLQGGVQVGHIRHGGVYAETFALWLLVFIGLSLLGAFFLQSVAMAARGALTLGISLLVLVWPVLRGIPWAQVRQDIGWEAGRGWTVTEFGAGLLCYIINLPFVALGVALTVVALAVQGHLAGTEAGSPNFTPSHLPAHPIVQAILSAEWLDLVPVFILGAVVAPLVEETMFRGILYRHLREATSGWSRVLSVILSILVVCFLFAAVHPNLVAIPVLMCLAIGFCIAREWRGTLLPSIFAHGLHNGCLLALLAALLH